MTFMFIFLFAHCVILLMEFMANGMGLTKRCSTREEPETLWLYFLRILKEGYSKIIGD